MKRGLFEGKPKQRILYTLWHNPLRFFSAREMAEINRVGIVSVKKIFQEFLKAGIARVMEKKGERYYGVDARSPVLEEIDDILGKQKFSQKDVIGQILRTLGDLKFVGLTGVFVGLERGQIDLLLVGTPAAKKLERAVMELSQLCGKEIDYALMSEKEFKDRLYSFDWFLKEVLDRGPVVLTNKINKRPRA